MVFQALIREKEKCSSASVQYAIRDFQLTVSHSVPAPQEISSVPVLFLCGWVLGRVLLKLQQTTFDEFSFSEPI